ncbi:MAG: hypothetical protein KC621_03625 [Myxococcales bacterium]|nr:hypothetical protein [Myxococcales bacterium]
MGVIFEGDAGFVPPQNVDNPLASPARPIPSVYAVLAAEFVVNGQGNTDMNLWWQDLVPGGGLSRKLIQVYPNVSGPTVAAERRVTLMGLSARRWPRYDSLGPGGLGFSYLLYAYFSGYQRGFDGFGFVWEERSWIDSFWVFFNQGSLGGAFDDPARAFATDPQDPVRVSEAWRVLPDAPAALTHPKPFIVDDENFEDNSDEPMGVLTFGPIAKAADPFDPRDPFYATPTEIFEVSLAGRARQPYGIHLPTNDPEQWIVPFVQNRLTDDPFGGGQVRRNDAEALKLPHVPGVPGRQVMIYYTAPDSINPPHPHQRLHRAASSR